jgi:hypothetical protein
MANFELENTFLQDLHLGRYSAEILLSRRDLMEAVFLLGGLKKWQAIFHFSSSVYFSYSPSRVLENR